MDMWNINQSDKLFPIKPNIHYFILSLPIQPTQPLFSPLHSPFLSNPPNPILSSPFSFPIQPTQPLFYPILSNQPLFSPTPSPFLSNPPNRILSYTFSLPI